MALKDQLLRSLSNGYEDVNVESASTSRKKHPVKLLWCKDMARIQYVCYAGQYLTNEIRFARETMPYLT